MCSGCTDCVLHVSPFLKHCIFSIFSASWINTIAFFIHPLPWRKAQQRQLCISKYFCKQHYCVLRGCEYLKEWFLLGFFLVFLQTEAVFFFSIPVITQKGLCDWDLYACVCDAWEGDIVGTGWISGRAYVIKSLRYWSCSSLQGTFDSCLSWARTCQFVWLNRADVCSLWRCYVSCF